MTKKTRFNIGYAIAAIFGILLIQYFFSMATQIATIPYSEFQKLLREGKVASVGVSDNFVQGTLKEPLSDGRTQFVTTRVDPEFARERDYAEATAALVDQEVRAMVERIFARTVALLKEQRLLLERGARELLEKETLNETELKELTSSLRKSALQAAR